MASRGPQLPQRRPLTAPSPLPTPQPPQPPSRFHPLPVLPLCSTRAFAQTRCGRAATSKLHTPFPLRPSPGVPVARLFIASGCRYCWPQGCAHGARPSPPSHTPFPPSRHSSLWLRGRDGRVEIYLASSFLSHATLHLGVNIMHASGRVCPRACYNGGPFPSLHVRFALCPFDPTPRIGSPRAHFTFGPLFRHPAFALT